MNFEELADQVLAIDSSKDRCDVILDLKYTKNVEETINRIFDGNVIMFSLLALVLLINFFFHSSSLKVSKEQTRQNQMRH
jgi:hypothetical protein